MSKGIRGAQALNLVTRALNQSKLQPHQRGFISDLRMVGRKMVQMDVPKGMGKSMHYVSERRANHAVQAACSELIDVMTSLAEDAKEVPDMGLVWGKETVYAGVGVNVLHEQNARQFFCQDTSAQKDMSNPDLDKDRQNEIH